jgi:drug/metabolite transporter (DMT)-like permease
MINSKTSERLEHSRHRSPIYFLVNLVAGLIAYCHQPKKPSLACNCSLYRRRSLSRTHVTYAILAGRFFLLVFSLGLIEEVRVAPLDATFALVYLGVFPSAIAYVSLAYTLARTSASTVASLLYLVSALAVFIAWIWLGEIPTAFSLRGGILILSGAVLVNMLGKAKT